jgi:S1-C subfamily serine protease
LQLTALRVLFPFRWEGVMARVFFRTVLAATVAALFSTSVAHAAEESGVQIGRFLFSRIAEKLPVGAEYADIRSGVICIPNGKLTSDGKLKPLSLKLYGPAIARAMFDSSTAAKGDRPDLFSVGQSQDQDVAYDVGALIHGMAVKICSAASLNTDLLNRTTRTDLGAKGDARLEIQWQIYSRAEHKVVETIETTGNFEQTQRLTPSNAVLSNLILGAFSENVRGLAGSEKFKALSSAPASKSEVASDAVQHDRIALATGTPTPQPVGQEEASVVVIDPGDGTFGSGFLVSTDGYILTDAHVVGSAKTVTLRWSDGLKTDGQVVRLHKKRDIALIKADPHGRTPLPIRVTPVQVGDTILAIGAPLDPRLQGTVTRGIVSAKRIQDGMALIQTDMVINHGNSGGPILDDKGYVVGLSESSVQPAYGVPIGINYLTPIKDALDFLAVDLPASAAATPPAQRVSGSAAKSKSVNR